VRVRDACRLLRLAVFACASHRLGGVNTRIVDSLHFTVAAVPRVCGGRTEEPRFYSGWGLLSASSQVVRIDIHW